MKTIDNQSMVLAYIAKNPDSDAKKISAETGIFSLNVYKILKGLLESKQISINEKKSPPGYNLINKGVKAIQSTIPTKKTPQEEKGEPEDTFPAFKTKGRDTSKLKFLGKEYFKGPLVLAVIEHYCQVNKTTLAKLKELFPDEMQPRYGTIQLLNTAKKLSEGKPRFFLKPEQLIKVGDAKIAVCNQWTSTNLIPFLKVAKKLGYNIK